MGQRRDRIMRRSESGPATHDEGESPAISWSRMLRFPRSRRRLALEIMELACSPLERRTLAQPPDEVDFRPTSLETAGSGKTLVCCRCRLANCFRARRASAALPLPKCRPHADRAASAPWGTLRIHPTRVRAHPFRRALPRARWQAIGSSN